MIVTLLFLLAFALVLLRSMNVNHTRVDFGWLGLSFFILGMLLPRVSI